VLDGRDTSLPRHLLQLEHTEKISMTTAVSRMNVLFFFLLQTIQIADSQYFTMNIPLQLRTLPTALNYSLISFASQTSF
jgi:hypothetical protein